MRKFLASILPLVMLVFCLDIPVQAKLPGVVGTFTDTSSLLEVPEFAEDVEFGGITKKAKTNSLEGNKVMYNVSGVQESEDVIKNSEATAYCSEKYLVMDMDIAIKNALELAETL